MQVLGQSCAPGRFGRVIHRYHISGAEARATGFNPLDADALGYGIDLR
jgi:hypothetical protein